MSLCLALAAAPALAQTPEAVLRDLLSAPPRAVQFAPGFLDQVPRPQLDAILDDLRDTIGPVTGIRLTGDAVLVTTATHRMRARIGLDGQGRVALLFFEPPQPLAGDLETALDEIAALGSEVAWLAMRDGRVLAENRAGVPLAVASTFKLGVLSVLAEDIASGARRWQDVVRLEQRHRSLPTGMMQDWPAGAPVTLHSAAALMIANSDNTATDLLIDTLGRNRVAAALGLETMLSTREFFALKGDGPAAAAYSAAPAADRSAIAARAAQTLPDFAAASGPHVPGVEWSLPLTRLCALIGPLADLPLMAINPGPVPAADWAQVAYKGGSEAGVLNLTAALRDRQGRKYCVAVTVNAGGTIDTARAIGAYRALLDVLAGLE